MVTDADEVEWISAGRLARVPVDPNYPNGGELHVSEGAAIPTPFKCAIRHPRSAAGKITRGLCGKRVAVSAAGVADDPTCVKIACGSLVNQSLCGCALSPKLYPLMLKLSLASVC